MYSDETVTTFPEAFFKLSNSGEIIMAKRRNQKKEKAARNLAYARQFRKKPTGSFSKGRRFSGGNNNNNNDNNNSNNGNAEGND